MYQIKKYHNYRDFANLLKEKTECDVAIRVMNKSATHIHYGLSKMGVPIGVLCCDASDGELAVTFAPFVTLDTAQNDMYFNVGYMPMLEDFVKALTAFKEIFVCEDESIVIQK